ncbi:MAG: transcriptional regulator NrdR [archaeon]
MKCPYCSSAELKVVDKRATEDSKATRRRRECLKCNKRFTTYERVEGATLIVAKKNGNREEFDRQKVEKGILKACEKRPVSHEHVTKIVDEIETDLRNMDKTEIESRVIGDLVMKKLKKLDKIAYIRFASVYREFADIDSFHEEVEKLLKK